MVRALAKDASVHEDLGSVTQTDQDLLKRFFSGDQSAFADLVQRHSRLVWTACRHILIDVSDAEDAFQATFLVLARKGKSLEWQDSIAGWLHQTARRTSLKLRAMTARRREIESNAARRLEEIATSSVANPAAQSALRELVEILDAELASLPDRFREVMLLSLVEGLPREEIAERLGVSSGAVKDRLERGRERLRSRLLVRGITLTAAFAAWLVPGTAEAANLATLTDYTARSAGAFATGSMAAGIAPTAVNLAQGVLNMMGFEKLRLATVFLFSLVTAGGIAYGALQDEPTRFEKGLRGHVVGVTTAKPATITISLEESGTLLNLDLASQAKVWTAFESGQISDLKDGQFVSVRLGTDHRTVNEIHVQGKLREGSIQSIAQSGKITVVEEDDDDGAGKPLEVELAPDAVLRIGGLPATRGDLKPGMQVPLEFGRDGKLVNAIEAEAEDNTLLEGRFLEEVNGTIHMDQEDGEEGQLVRHTLSATAETIVLMDGKPAKIADLKRGASIRLRVSSDGNSVRAIKAISPSLGDENDDK